MGGTLSFEGNSRAGVVTHSDSATVSFSSTDFIGDGVFTRLGPLQDNGGPTETHLPEPGSPVVDAIQGPVGPAAGAD